MLHVVCVCVRFDIVIVVACVFAKFKLRSSEKQGSRRNPDLGQDSVGIVNDYATTTMTTTYDPSIYHHCISRTVAVYSFDGLVFVKIE